MFVELLILNLFGLALFVYLYDKKIFLTWCMMAFLSILGIIYWRFSVIFLVTLLLPVVKRTKIITTAVLCMPSTIMLSWFLFNYPLTASFALPFAYVAVIAISLFAIHAMFEDDVQQFLAWSNLIQFIFVALDMSIAVVAGKELLKTIQIFNYGITGLLFFLALGALAKHRKSFAGELWGVFFEDKWNGAFASIAAISLAGLPLFNIFVSEWYLFTASYLIDPLISILGIFAALVLFIMYFKVAYVLFSGRSEHRPIPISITIFNAILCLAVFVFAVPQTQLLVLGVLS